MTVPVPFASPINDAGNSTFFDLWSLRRHVPLRVNRPIAAVSTMAMAKRLLQAFHKDSDRIRRDGTRVRSHAVSPLVVETSSDCALADLFS